MIQIATQKEILNFFEQQYSHRKQKIWAFYNSQLNKIIVDQKYMLIPIDDRLATRGHGAFDALFVQNKKIINLDQHVQRFYASSRSVGINLLIQKQKVKQIIIQVMKTVFKHYIETKGQNAQQKLQNAFFGIRTVISSGYGDFGISSIDKSPVFYIFVYEPSTSLQIQEKGVKEYVVNRVKQINSDLVHAKTVNYLQNAMMANASKQKGGFIGIKALQDGTLLQASIANIGFIFGKQFATPRLETVIQGTTLIKLTKYIQKLRQQGLIQKISFRDISIQQAQKADQMMIFGGDKIIPVLQFNDVKISNKRGKFTQMFQNWYRQVNYQLTGIQE